MPQPSPSDVKILGQHFKIQFVDRTTPMIWGGEKEMRVGSVMVGYCAANDQEIYVRAIGFDQTRDTLLHEILHAIMAVTGGENEVSDAKAERLVSAISPVLLDVLRSNPQFTAYLLEEQP